MSSDKNQNELSARAEPVEQPEQRPIGLFQKLTSSPLFTFTGWACTVIGLIAFFVTQEKRDLTFAVNPVRTALVQSGQTTQLKVSYLGKEIPGDITACQIALWNSGKQAIKKSEILEPITLSLTNVQIMEAILRRASRNVTGIILDGSQIQSGRIAISWNILEKDDGSPEPHCPVIGISKPRSWIRLPQPEPVASREEFPERGRGRRSFN